jgi:hypothetical protein
MLSSVTICCACDTPYIYRGVNVCIATGVGGGVSVIVAVANLLGSCWLVAVTEIV